MLPRSPAEFETLMNEVDERLRRGGADILRRAFLAIWEINQITGASAVAYSSGPINMEGYTDENINAHVQQWYRDKYGSRVNIDPSPGSFIVELRRKQHS